MIKKWFPQFFYLALIMCSCVSSPPPSTGRGHEAENPAPERQTSERQTPERQTPERRLVRTEPEQTPPWKDNPPRSQDEIFFVGLSRSYASNAEARNDARENAFTQVMRFYGEFIQSGAVERSSVSGSSADTFAALVNREEELMNFAQAVVSQVGTDGYYTEVYLDAQNREAYIVYALCRIPRHKAEQDIADFAKNTSERYGSLLAVPASLQAALLTYRETLRALEQNPLHRTVAYYDSPAGRVNLYEYLGLHINTLAGDVSFAPLPSATVEKGDTLDTAVQILTPLSAVGLDCAVNVYGMNNAAPAVRYTVGADSSFQLRIFSSRLEPGNYTVQLELLLNRIDPRIQRNPAESFNLVVQPLSAAVDFNITGSGVGGPEKAALVQGIQQGIEHYGVPVSLKPEGPAGSTFTVTLNLCTQDTAGPVNRSLVICDTAIAFSRDGTTLGSASRRISEIDAPNAVNQVRRFIAENQEFFRNISVKLSQ
jgi:hypothetical protein